MQQANSNKGKDDIQHPGDRMLRVLGLDLPAHLKVVMASMAYYDGPGGCYPSMQTIADHANLHRATVNRHIRTLVKLGRLTVQRGQHSNRYIIHYENLTVAPDATLENNSHCSTPRHSTVAPDATQTGINRYLKKTPSLSPQDSRSTGEQPPPKPEKRERDDFFDNGKSKPERQFKGVIMDWLTDDELDLLRLNYPGVKILDEFKDFDMHYHGETLRKPYQAINTWLKNARDKGGDSVVHKLVTPAHQPVTPQHPKVWNRPDNPEYHKQADEELAAMIDEQNRRKR